MKRLTFIILCMCALSLSGNAQQPERRQGPPPMSQEEFRAHQKAFLVKRAHLTDDEANKFFPIYFEMKEKKHKLDEENWKAMRDMDNATEAQYDAYLKKMMENRLSSDQLDRAYYPKFRTILSAKKLFFVHRAEMHFNREILKGFRPQRRPEKKQ